MSDDRAFATGGYLPDGFAYQPAYGYVPSLGPYLLDHCGRPIDFGPPVPDLYLINPTREQRDVIAAMDA